jgi:rubrerythrin
MSETFNAAEVLQIAKRIEQNGVRFYEAASARAEDPVTRQLLSDLARMEEEHVRRFDAMIEKTADARERVFDPEGDTGKILRAWADGSVFRVSDDTGPPLTGRETMAEILDKAVQLEKDSVVFYLGLKETATSTEDREQIDRILAEEMRHIAFLGEVIARMGESA